MSGYIDQQLGQYGDVVRKTVSTVATPDNPMTVGPGKPGESAVGGTALPQSSNIENKTQAQNYKFIQSSEQNVLNGYRSYTYNFTLAALSLAEVNNPDSYRGTNLSRVILKSGGKGPDAIANDSELSSNFNEKSPGRFDMFIDNLQIDSLMTFTEKSSVSLPVNLSFEVIEPYSISGFIEALQVAAISAGYPSYASASFVLKMDFLGYPDSVPVEDANVESIPNSSRYFLFKFTGVSVDVNEQGTRYRCTAVPWNQSGFGEPNKLKKPIQIVGTTVKDILGNFMKKLNEQIIEADKESKDVDKNIHDEYDIVFPSVSSTGFDTKEESKLFDINIADFKENRSIEFVDQANPTSKDAYDGPRAAGGGRGFINPESDKLDTTGKTTAQFAAGAAIHECIASVIRDSKFGRKIIENLSEKIDEYGFFNYFLINIEVTNLLKFDSVKRKPAQKYTYVITPYRMHYTNVPGYNAQNIDVKKIKQYVSLREYNYLYMGKNVDVLNFKINFNTLFFEAMPYAAGNNDRPRDIDTAALAGGNKPGETAWDSAAAKQSYKIPVADKKTIAEAGDVKPPGGTGAALDTDPYTIMSRNMHQAIINSRVGMATGEIEIIGDPFFLVTGGTGNYNPKLENIGKTVNGESAYNYGEVFVTINFRNPIDISTFAQGGQVYFSKENVQFSGVYKVNKVQSSFKSGLFTQRLELMRLPGQISDNTPASKAKDAMTSKANPADTPVEDASAAIMPGLRATISSPGLLASAGAAGLKVHAGFNLASTLDRALPGPGNFTAAPGGLGGNLSNSVSGAVSDGISAVTAGASVFGGNIPGGVDQLASGIRLNVAGLTSTGGIQDKIDALTAGTSLDPTGMASKLGINPNQISGLGDSLKSKLLGQLGSFAKDVPANVDLGTAQMQGLALDLIPKGKLGNIPALATFASAPLPELPKFGSTNITSDVAASFAKFNPLAGISTPSVTNPLSNIYSQIPGKK